MDKKELKYTLFNSVIICNAVSSVLLDCISDTVNMIKAVLGIKPAFTGQMRLSYRVMSFFDKGYENIIIKPTGVYSGKKLLEDPRFQIMEFMPVRGLKISAKDRHRTEQIINSTSFSKDPLASIEFYRIKALFALISAGFILSFLATLFVLFSPYFNAPLSKKIALFMWTLPNLYFFSQTILFYLTRLKHLSMKTSFEEASEAEEKELRLSHKQPYVVSVVPTYMEDPDLLKRTLYSICLQSYSNMSVVMLLGNDYYSCDKSVIDNTKRMKLMFIDIKKEIHNQKQKIRKQLNTLEPIGKEGISLPASGFIHLGNIYMEVSSWFIGKARELRALEVKYPIDSYLIKNTFISRYRYFKRQSVKCLKAAKGLPCCINPEELYKELYSLFNIKLDIFMRTRYENLEQEKTKAGNLSAYSSIIGGTWCRKKQSNGRFVLKPSRRGKHIKEPLYFASFDSDTILKPDYIVRKVAFLEREENQGVGLIQSPYVVPTPEETPAASASGVLSYWFLPVSVGLSAYKSACWLGFNCVMRFEAVKKIKTFLTDTIIEDTQNGIKIKREGYEIITSPEEQCTTFSPSDLNGLKVQRTRWASGGFKIAKDLLLGFIRKEPGFKTFTEKVLVLNYVLGLNLLPIAITSLLFIESPFYKHFFFVETIPFFLYILSYVCLLRSLTNYKPRHIIDGLSVSIFSNLYHLAGTYNSLKGLIFGNKVRFFNSTRKSKNAYNSTYGDLEFFGIILIITWLGMRLINQLLNYEYFDIFPLYHILMALYGVVRFGDLRKKALENPDKIRIKSGFFNKRRLLRMSALLSAFALLFVIPAGTWVYKWNNLNNTKNTAALVIYENRTAPVALDPFEQAKKLGQGINLGNYLESPNVDEWKVHLKDKHFEIIKDAGFDTIRVPINWSGHAQKKSPYKVDEAFFIKIDWIILNAKRNSLNVVLDFHNYYEIYHYPEKHTERFISIWKQIAQRYKACDSSLYYEILNEPSKEITPDVWNNLAEETIGEIRKIDPYHSIILSGALWGSSYGLLDLKIPSDEKNVICTYHTYTPLEFTHQGADYAQDKTLRYLKNIVWPGPPKEQVRIPAKLKGNTYFEKWFTDYNTLPGNNNPAGPEPLLKELDMAFDWSKERNVPVWLGEFGVTKNADITSRMNWMKFIVTELEKREIPWAYWDFYANCGIYDLNGKMWEESLLDALIH